MKIREPEFRCGGNWDELALFYGYKIDPNDQDWTYTISEPEKIDNYIVAYNTIVTNPDTKFSLMEMIFEALDGQDTQKEMNSNWEVVKALLVKDFSLHEYTIFYWCDWDNENIEDCFRITPLVREFWLEC